MNLQKPLALAAITISLAACVPTATDPKTGTGETTTKTGQVVPTGKTTFYPHNTGFVWSYLPEGDAANSPLFKLEVLGPTVFRSKTLTAVRFSGRAADQTCYRDYTNGVQLHGCFFPETGELLFEPPLQEYPPEEQMKIGANWNGETTVTEPVKGGKPKIYQLLYSYRVLVKEQYKIGNTIFDTLRINVEFNTSTGEKLTQMIRFVPNLGEVSTKEGLALIGKNF